jgi:hypothetical protein
MKQPPEPEPGSPWIRCCRFMPEPNDRVLFVVKQYRRCYIGVGHLSGYAPEWVDVSNCDSDGDPDRHPLSVVTHWAPLPELP